MPRSSHPPSRGPLAWLRRLVARANALADAVDSTEMDASVQTGCAARRPNRRGRR